MLGTAGTSLAIGRVLNAHGGGNLTAAGGVKRFVGYPASNHDAVLVVLDAEDQCPVERLLHGEVRVPSQPRIGCRMAEGELPETE